MNPYIEKLKAQFAENPPCYGYTDANSLLEMLYLWYTEWNPINSEAIQNHFRQLEDFICVRTGKEYDNTLDLITALCSLHEKLAFLEGIRVGFQLSTELDA